MNTKTILGMVTVLVVVGMGVRPATDFLHGIDLLPDGSLAVDQFFCAAQNVYAAGSVKGDQAGGTAFSNFCAQCHQNWHESISTTNASGDDWKRHPVDNPITDTSPNSGAGVEITRFDNYNTNPVPSPLALGTSTGATKLPAMQATGAGAYYFADDAADRVFCLSCHYAHGGPNNDILRWNYTSAVSAGSQTGNAIATNVGCQQCHNR